MLKLVWVFYPARKVCLTEMTDHLVIHVLFMLHQLPETIWWFRSGFLDQGINRSWTEDLCPSWQSMQKDRALQESGFSSHWPVSGSMVVNLAPKCPDTESCRGLTGKGRTSQQHDCFKMLPWSSCFFLLKISVLFGWDKVLLCTQGWPQFVILLA